MESFWSTVMIFPLTKTRSANSSSGKAFSLANKIHILIID
jgi:hypothetical protein